jgi:hypothetical protein
MGNYCALYTSPDICLTLSSTAVSVRPNPQECSGSGGVLPYLRYNTTLVGRRFRKACLDYHLETSVRRIVSAVTG